ncbi:MAG: DHHA2 domain-containing protein, partial [Ignavibacteriales bacterium]
EQKDPLTMVSEDLKEYSFADLDFAIGQFETADKSILKGMTESLRTAMASVCSTRGYDLMFLMITDIFVEGTELLIAGPKAEIGSKIFGDASQNRFSLDGVMSRKKQLVPTIFKALARQQMM